MHQYIHNNLGMSSLTIVFPAGPAYESYGTRGTSHLMEHLVCKTYNHLRDELQMKGIMDDAITDDEGVYIVFSGLSEELDPMQKLLVDTITGGIDCVTEEMFNSEKKTVLAEIGSMRESPVSALEMFGLRKFCNYYAAPGCECDVEKFSYDDMKRVYTERFTRPLNIISIGPRGINLPGVKFSTPEEFRERTLTFNPGGFTCDTIDDIDCERYTPFIHMTRLVSKEDYPKMFLGIKMLTDGLNSPIETEIREKRGLCYNFVNDLVVSRDSAIFIFGGYAPTENMNEIERLYDELICNVGRFLTEERFNVCKKMAMVSRDKRNILRFANVDDLLAVGRLNQFDGLDDITFGQVFDTVKKYINPETIVRIRPVEEKTTDDNGNEDVTWPVRISYSTKA